MGESKMNVSDRSPRRFGLGVFNSAERRGPATEPAKKRSWRVSKRPEQPRADWYGLKSLNSAVQLRRHESGSGHGKQKHKSTARGIRNGCSPVNFIGAAMLRSRLIILMNSRSQSSG